MQASRVIAAPGRSGCGSEALVAEAASGGGDGGVKLLAAPASDRKVLAAACPPSEGTGGI